VFTKTTRANPQGATNPQKVKNAKED